MSHALAAELWTPKDGQPQKLIPVFFTAQRQAHSLYPMEVIETAKVTGVEAVVTVLKRNRVGRGVLTFLGYNNDGRLDVARAKEEAIAGSLYKLALDALAGQLYRETGELKALNPYLRVNSLLFDGRTKPSHTSTIIFPFFTVTRSSDPSQRLSPYSMQELEETWEDKPNTCAPTLLHDTKTAVEAATSRTPK